MSLEENIQALTAAVNNLAACFKAQQPPALGPTAAANAVNPPQSPEVAAASTKRGPGRPATASKEAGAQPQQPAAPAQPGSPAETKPVDPPAPADKSAWVDGLPPELIPTKDQQDASATYQKLKELATTLGKDFGREALVAAMKPFGVELPKALSVGQWAAATVALQADLDKRTGKPAAATDAEWA